MGKLSIYVVAVGLSLFLGLSVCLADSIDERAAELLPWVAERSGYKAEHVKVTVLLVDRKLIDLIAHRGEGAGQTELESVSVGQTIFLPNWFKLGKNDDILVHELTHVLQFDNEAAFRCRAEQEKQAYEIQAAFTDETGIGTKPHPFFMFLLRCPTKSAPH